MLRVLMTVSIPELYSTWHLLVLDWSALGAHLCIARGSFDLPGITSTQRELGARCAAEALLQLTPPLIEVRCGTKLVQTLLACKVVAALLLDRQLMETCIVTHSVPQCPAKPAVWQLH